MPGYNWVKKTSPSSEWIEKRSFNIPIKLPSKTHPHAASLKKNIPIKRPDPNKQKQNWKQRKIDAYCHSTHLRNDDISYGSSYLKKLIYMMQGKISIQYLMSLAPVVPSMKTAQILKQADNSDLINFVLRHVWIRLYPCPHWVWPLINSSYNQLFSRAARFHRQWRSLNKEWGGATFVNLAAKAMNNIKTSVELMEILHGKEEPWPSMAIITLRQCSSGWRNQGVGKN